MSNQNKSKSVNSKKQPRKGRNIRSKGRNNNNNMFELDSAPTSGHQKAYNDPQWYAKTPQLLKDAASYPFNVATGNSLNMATIEGYSSTIGDRAAGIMTIEIIPHLGISTKATDPVNVAATSMLSYIVHANSRNLSYGRADLMLAIGAADSFFSFVNWCQRLYGIARNPRQWNRYTAAALVRANGVNFSDLLANLNDFRSWLNQLIIKGSAIWVPNTLPIMKKHAWMFSNVYRDDQNEQSQMYMFVPSLFYKYDETSSQQGGQLVPQWISNVGQEGDAGIVEDAPLMNFAQIRNLGESLIQAILDSEDIQVIFGDILKAYGENNLFKLITIDESYSIDAVYNEEVLLEITNAFSAPRATVYGNVTAEYSIKQDVDNQIITFSPNLYTKYMGYELNKLINFNWDTVSPENLMVATRLVPSLTKPEATNGPWFKYQILSAGTELVAGFRIFTMMEQPGKVVLFKTKRFDSVLYHSTNQQELQYRAASSTEIVDLVTKLEHFDWHPTIYCISTSTGFGSPTSAVIPDNIVLDGVIADICNANSIAYKDLINLDYTALLSEFDVPV